MDEYKYDIKAAVSFEAELEGYNEADIARIPSVTTSEPERVADANRDSREALRIAIEQLKNSR